MRFKSIILPECLSKLLPLLRPALQESERMNKLTTEMKRSLRELDLGLRGVLTMTPEMENLSNSLFLDQVPGTSPKLIHIINQN